MLVDKLSRMKDGWIIGNFDPAILKTDKFEVSIKHHNKDEKYVTHIHKQSTEYNVLVSGKMIIQDTVISPGDIFIIQPWEISDPKFIEDCVVVVVRSNSIPGDKFEYLPKN
jgi:mannose-6-phosphate isomerase-like protein (cupin superfamily)